MQDRTLPLRKRNPKRLVNMVEAKAACRARSYLDGTSAFLGKSPENGHVKAWHIKTFFIQQPASTDYKNNKWERTANIVVEESLENVHTNKEYSHKV